MSLQGTELTKRLEQIAAFSAGELAVKTLNELKDLARDVISGFTRLNKQKLIDELLERTTKIREANELAKKNALLEQSNAVLQENASELQETVSELAEVVAQTEAVENIDSQLAEKVYAHYQSDEYFKLLPTEIGTKAFVEIKNVITEVENKISNLESKIRTITNEIEIEKAYSEIRALKSSLTKSVSVLAGRIAAVLTAQYPNTVSVKKPKTDIHTEMEKLRLDNRSYEYYPLLAEKLAVFKDSLDGFFTTKITKIDLDYKAKVRVSNSDNKVIDAIGLFNWAKEVIDRPTYYDWTELAMALAFATASRPFEIFSYSEFKPINKQWILKTGFAKARKSWNPLKTVELPCLIDAYKVCEAIQLLRNTLAKENRYQDYAPIRQQFTDLIIKKGFKPEDIANGNYPVSLFSDDDFISIQKNLHLNASESTDKNTAMKLSRTYARLADKFDSNKYTMKDFRAISANTSLKIFFSDEHGILGSATTFLSIVLDHDNEATTKSYEKFRVSDMVLDELKALVFNQ